MNLNTERIKNKRFTNAIDSETSKKSCEYRVLATLRYLYSDMYNNMKNDDSPDLQDKVNNVGIEVTKSCNDKEMAASSAYYKLMRCDELEVIEEQRRIINKNNCSLIETDDGTRHMLSFGTYYDEKNFFQNAIKKKLDKLDKYKKSYEKVGLAILIEDIPCYEFIDNIKINIDEVYNNNNKFYDFIYVISSSFCIYYDINEEIYEKKELTKDESLKLKTIGRMTAEKEIDIENDVEWK